MSTFRTMFSLSLALMMGTVALAQRNDETHLGGCILKNPGVEAPEDPYYDTGLVRTEEFKPQTKKIGVYGFILSGNDDITDQFMLDVSQTIKEMFPRNRGLDEAKQKEFLVNMHRYRPVIPMFDNAKGFLKTPEDEKAWEPTEESCSVCDAIFKTPRGQAMEVVEHILHYASDIGLHYTFPDEWGISEDSEINKFMDEAIERKLYVVEQYDRFGEEAEVYRRVLIQEFAYWVITTMWNLQEPYGPTAEWHVKNRVELRNLMPELFEMHERTVATVMVAPNLSTLDKFPDGASDDDDDE